MIDLSGRWTGSYAYPGSLAPVAFEAEIRDDAGLISGLCSEASDGLAGPDLPTHSSFSGRHADHEVLFTKIYDSHDQPLEPIEYYGMLTSDACEISGVWRIGGEWSGPFVMMRPRPSPVAIEVEASETV